jgi:hypothetical protein
MLFKTINYRGGVLRFRIPSDWVEEYEDSGGGTFYEPGDDAGTLRVNVTTLEGPPGRNPTVDRLVEQFASAPEFFGATPVHLGEDAIIFRYDMPGEERGRTITVHCWSILQVVAPRNFRHVLFTYTLPPDTPACAAEMDVLDREIAAVQLSPRLGKVM